MAWYLEYLKLMSGIHSSFIQITRHLSYFHTFVSSKYKLWWWQKRHIYSICGGSSSSRLYSRDIQLCLLSEILFGYYKYSLIIKLPYYLKSRTINPRNLLILRLNIFTLLTSLIIGCMLLWLVKERKLLSSLYPIIWSLYMNFIQYTSNHSKFSVLTNFLIVGIM